MNQEMEPVRECLSLGSSKRRLAIDDTLKIAEFWAVRHVVRAFYGDVDAADALCTALGNANRGIVAVLMWQAEVEPAAYRVFLGAAWEHDHRHVMAAAGTRRRLAAMFAYAAFPLPDALGDTVRVWRGTSALTVFQARAGLSWTLDRDVACWFAMRFAAPPRRPLVLLAEISRDAIAYHTNARDEAEVVLLSKPAAVIDGNENDWQVGHAAYQAGIQQAHERRLADVLRERIAADATPPAI